MENKDKEALSKLENFASPKTLEALKNNMINEKNILWPSKVVLTPEELQHLHNVSVSKTTENRLKSLGYKYANTAQNNPKRYYQLMKAADNSYDALKSAKPIALETVKPSKSILSKLIRLVKFSEDQSALQRLEQFAEKKEEDKPISYYMKNGAKWGGISGAIGGTLAGTTGTLSVSTDELKNEIKNDPEFIDSVNQIKNQNPKMTDEKINNIVDKTVFGVKYGAPVIGGGVYGVLGAGLGAGAGLAYGGAKKIVKSIKKDK